MPTVKYERGKERILKGQIDFEHDNIKACFLDSNYPGGLVSAYEHEFYSDISSYVIPSVETCITLTSKTFNRSVPLGTKGGVFGAADILHHNLQTGHTIGYLIIFKDTASTVNGAPATPGTAPLVVMIDSGYGIGLNTNGGNVSVAWDPVNKIFEI